MSEKNDNLPRTEMLVCGLAIDTTLSAPLSSTFVSSSQALVATAEASVQTLTSSIDIGINCVWKSAAPKVQSREVPLIFLL